MGKLLELKSLVGVRLGDIIILEIPTRPSSVILGSLIAIESEIPAYIQDPATGNDYKFKEVLSYCVGSHDVDRGVYECIRLADSDTF